MFEDEIYDPLEGINRAIFGFNNVADKVILEPAAKGYKKLPAPVQSGVGNFIQNLKLPLVAFNQLLQGQGKNAAESTGRFLVNSTIGISSPEDITSFAERSSLLPRVPPGWDFAKSSGLKSFLFISEIANASPQTRVAVALEVGARSSGHASFSTFIN